MLLWRRVHLEQADIYLHPAHDWLSVTGYGWGRGRRGVNLHLPHTGMGKRVKSENLLFVYPGPADLWCVKKKVV